MRNQADLPAFFEECVEALARGESLEACLRRYPDHADELRPLLTLVMQARAVATVQPRPLTAAAQNKSAFLELAAERRMALQKRQPPPTQSRFSIFDLFTLGRRWAVTAAAILVMVLVFGTGGIIASANTLPGDTLYPVKRATENVQRLLTINPAARQRLEQDLIERRRAEVQDVLEAGRTVALDFTGPVEFIQDGIWQIDGLTVRVTSFATILGQPQVGDWVHVQGQTTGDELIEAHTIRRVEPPALAVPTSTPVPPPPAATFTPVPSPTHAKPTATPVQPTPTFTATPTMTATATMSPTPTATPSPTATATLTPGPPTRVVSVRFEGEILEKQPDQWNIAGRIIVLSDTEVDQSNGSAVLGAWVQVVGFEQADGSVVAQRIVVLKAAGTLDEPYHFSDVIESMSGGYWTVGGLIVYIRGDTVFEGAQAAVGLLVHVQAVRRPNGELWARHVSVESPELEEVFLEGPIRSINGDRWQVGNVTVMVDGQTQITGQASVGKRAQVQGLLQSDGSVLARSIVIVEPTSTPQTTADD